MRRLSNVILPLVICASTLLFIINAFSGDIEDGHELFLRQRYDDAISKYKSALKNAAGDEAANIHFYLGRAYEMKNWYEAALTEFTKIRDKYPGHTILGETMLETGQCYVRSQRMDDALETFENASKMFDDPWIKASSIFNKAVLQCSFNRNVFDLDAAVKSFQSIINDYSFEDLSIKAWYWLGYTYNRQKKYDKAIDAWNHVIKEGPETLWADLAQVYIPIAQRKLGQTDSAVKWETMNFAYNNRAAKIFQQMIETQNTAGDGVYLNSLPNDAKDGDLQLVELNLVAQGKVIYRSFIKAKSIKYSNDKRIISVNGSVRITDRLTEPLFLLEASDVSITDELKATANGNVNLMLKNLKEEGKSQEMKNLDSMEIDLRTNKFSISGEK